MAEHRLYVMALVVASTAVVIEMAGGLMIGSMSVLSDGLHMLLDHVPLLLAYFAFHKHRRGEGSGLLEYATTALNMFLLVVGMIVMIWQGHERMLHPSFVPWEWAFVLGMAGFAGSAFLTYVFHYRLHAAHKHAHTSRGMALHYLMDMLSSVAVVAGAIATNMGVAEADGYATFAVAAATAYAVHDLLQELRLQELLLGKRHGHRHH